MRNFVRTIFAPLARISIYLLSPHPPSPRRRSARSSAEPPPFRHAKGVPPFPLSGKSTPQRLLRNRGKVGAGVVCRCDDGPPDSFVTLSACHLSRYRESLPHKACRFSACGGRSVWAGGKPTNGGQSFPQSSAKPSERRSGCYIYNDIRYPQLSIFHFQFSTFYVYNAVAKCAAFAPLGQFSTFNFL